MNSIQPYFWGLILLFTLGISMPPSATIASPNHPAAAISQIRIQLDKPFPLRLHQTATLQTAKGKDGTLQITFLKVTEDSRCPSDVACVWAGQASVQVAIAKHGKPYRTVTLTQTPQDQAAAVIKIDRYTLKFVDLQPYPKNASPQVPPIYTATFRVF